MRKSKSFFSILLLILSLGVFTPLTTSCSSKTIIIKPQKGKKKGHIKKVKKKGKKKIIIIK